MMNWEDNLQAASFRGVPFLVDGDTLSGGRRGPTHEYPYKEFPYNEDMGHKARTYKFAAYVIGDDYFQKRDAVIKALETKGPGELVHPQYGLQNVALKSYVVKHHNDRGREATLKLVFAQEEEVNYPESLTNLLADINQLQISSLTQLTNQGLNTLARWF